MRNLLLLALVLSLAACGGKKAPQAPSNQQTESVSDDSKEEKDMAAPTDPDASPKTADPCEGGE